MLTHCDVHLTNQSGIAEGAHAYRAYGLLIASEVAIPHFLEAARLETPDVRIRRDAIFGGGYQPPTNMTIEALPGKLLLRGATSATFLITGGNSIVFEPLPGGNPSTIRQILLGWAFAGLFHQRGMMSLHGSALCAGEDCFVLCAPAGGGKSTLAASFLNAGYTFLDDNMALTDFKDGEAYVVPGSPELRLWEDAMRGLAFDYSMAGRIRADVAKMSLIAEKNFRQEKARLSKIFVLKKCGDSEVSFVNISGAAKFRVLMENLFGIPLMGRPAFGERIFQRVHQLALRVPVVQVMLPEKRLAPDKLRDLIISAQLKN